MDNQILYSVSFERAWFAKRPCYVKRLVVDVNSLYCFYCPLTELITNNQARDQANTMYNLCFIYLGFNVRKSYD